VLGSEFAFDVEVASGMGSYVCGEETALLESLEGRRGEVRVRPPYPVEEGLDGLPTVVNNVETLVDVPWIVREGGAAYRALGSQRTPGSKALCLSTGFARPGVLEVEYGIPLGEVVAEWAGGGQGGAALAGVVLGGPMGCIVLRDAWDVPLDPLALRERGLELGHGGIVALPEGVAWGELLEHWLAFMADESCGKCVPCRLGSRRALELARVRDGETAALRTLLHLMRDTSLCGFGQRIPLVGEQLLDLARPGAGSAS
jgi:NADH:ubiquinone oxidoreductase subunit F (NADH-binding)